MSESQLVMEFIAEHPVAVEAMVKRAIKDGVKEMMEERKGDIIEHTELEVKKAVKGTLLKDRHLVWLEYAKILTEDLMEERKSLKEKLQDLDERMESIEDEGGADWWKKG